MEQAFIFRTWKKNLIGKAVGCQSLIVRQLLGTAAHRVHETYLLASRLSSSYYLSSPTHRRSAPLLAPAESFIPELLHYHHLIPINYHRQPIAAVHHSCLQLNLLYHNFSIIIILFLLIIIANPSPQCTTPVCS